MTDLAAIATRFARETAGHKMTVLHDDGIYRHLRFRGERSFYWFSLVTAPGSLIFQGDGTSFVFSRVQDMFEFFRGQRVNPSYWAEKVTSGSGGRDSVMSYSREMFAQQVAEAFAVAAEDGVAPDGLAAAFQAEITDWHDVDYEVNARQLLNDFEHDGFRFYDTWEWNLQDYNWWFLWSLHAIVWGIAQYDQAKGQCRYDVDRLLAPQVSLRKPLTAPKRPVASGTPRIVTEHATGGVL